MLINLQASMFRVKNKLFAALKTVEPRMFCSFIKWFIFNLHRKEFFFLYRITYMYYSIA
jgi:hypothetical protein